MKILSSNLPPLNLGGNSYSYEFIDKFFAATAVTMVVAYVSGDSVVELDSLIGNHAKLKAFDLIVGMAKFDGLYQSQMDALSRLQSNLETRALGNVHFSTALPIHAKISLFEDGEGNPQASILGSSNLTGLIKDFRQFEIDALIDDTETLEDVSRLIGEIKRRSCIEFNLSKAQVRTIENPNLVLSGVPNVKQVDSAQLRNKLTKISFDLEVKTEPKSNLNIYFGEGRRQSGKVIPRPWYEVEIIVGVAITRLPGYPQAGTSEAEFDVVTDDGWRFPCQIQGQNSKNFRSKDDLRTLGKWIKERLQNAGALTIGDPVTDQTLISYGRNSLKFTKIDEPNLWYLDFSRPDVN